MRLSPPGTHFTAESTEAMQIKCLPQGHNILMSGFEQSTSVTRGRHSNHSTNMQQYTYIAARHRIVSSSCKLFSFRHCYAIGNCFLVSHVNDVDVRMGKQRQIFHLWLLSHLAQNGPLLIYENRYYNHVSCIVLCWTKLHTHQYNVLFLVRT